MHSPLRCSALAATTVLASTAITAVARAASPTRFSYAGDCVGIVASDGSSLAPAAGPIRMQASALGEYLLYTAQGEFVSDLASGATEPSPGASTVWRLDGPPFRLTNTGTGVGAPVRFTAARGCRAFPEAQVDATGTPARGAAPQADVLGTMEGHAHITAFELFGGNWHCGRLWSPYGAPDALPASCDAEEQGTNGAFQTFLDFGGPTRPSDFRGWPTFHNWPTPSTLAEEQDYWTAIERAWKAGLRLMVTDLVDNEALCGVMTTRTNPCNDMASVRVQSRDLRGVQDYIDAQSGGPGKGWLRIVTDPFGARRVINQGKLAVVEGVEMSRIFGCGEMNGTPQCDIPQIESGLNEFESLGVRTFFPVHEFDNAFGGTKGIDGESGAIVNAGNRLTTGHFMTQQPCSASEQDAQQLSTPPTGALASLFNGPAASLLGGNPLPVYGEGPQCNPRGLTDLGAYLVTQMARRHLIVQTDHMSSKTADGTLRVAERLGYPGIVSAHCCSSPQLFRRIYQLGGYVNPPANTPEAFTSIWKMDRAQRDPRFHFGFGYGSDMEGLAHQPGPTNGNPIRYPFTSFDGHVRFTREVWGQRTFDINTDGLANYGLYADWLAALQKAGGRPLLSDMFQGSEAYLQMWERAEGVPLERCRSSEGHFAENGTERLHLGSAWRSVLFALGQPASRPRGVFRYCVDGAPGRALAAVFDRSGRTELWLTNARGYTAGSISPGRSASALSAGSGARRLAPDVMARGRLIYVVHGGRVRAVGTATRSLRRSPPALAAAIAAARLR